MVFVVPGRFYVAPRVSSVRPPYILQVGINGYPTGPSLPIVPPFIKAPYYTGAGPMIGVMGGWGIASLIASTIGWGYGGGLWSPFRYGWPLLF